MNCTEFNGYLDDFEALTDEQKLEMNTHAASCDKCRSEMDFMMSIIETMHTLPKIQVPADFADKLSARIDIEEKKRASLMRRAMRNISVNRNRYTAAAACFALVAVLTANGTKLVDDMVSRDSNGVVDTETTEIDAGDNAVSMPDLISTFAPAAEPETVLNSPRVNVSDKGNENNKDAAGRHAVPQVNSVRNAATAGPAIRSVSSAEGNQASQPVSTVAALADNTSEASSEPAGLNDEDMLPMRSMYRMQPEEDDNIVAYSDIEDNIPQEYSLASAEDGISNIAHGRYYRSDNTAQVVEAPKAIGSIRISADDKAKAMGVILLYSYANGDFYTTDSDKLYYMLVELAQMGINYDDYTPGGYGDVTFRLVIS